MADQFRDCFVGEKGYDALKRLMRTSNDFSQELARCWQDRYDAELAYVKALRKTSDTLHKLSGKMKGSVNQALDIIATQTEKECEAHTLMANVLLNQLSIPLKNLADNQVKERKTIDDSLNGKLRILKQKKDDDIKYRTRQFEKSQEIETYYMKISEGGKSYKSSTRDSTKEGILSTPLMKSCILPAGRQANSNEKSTAITDPKHQASIEAAIQKAEEDLEKTDRKYHEATKNVELARQVWDGELCRSCDQMEQMELNRLTEMEKFIQIYAQTMQVMAESLQQVSHDLFAIRVSPTDDLIGEARTNVQTPEIEILLYDIYAENENNPMAEHRRISSLMRWKEWLQQDIESYRRIKDTEMRSSTLSKSSSDSVFRPTQSVEEESSSSNDDDGAMHHRREKKNKEANHNANQKKDMTMDEILFTRQSAYAFRSLFEGSLYKIEKVYNRLRKFAEPRFEHSERFAKTFTPKGYPLTFLRIPTQAATHTPPSAPPTAAGRSFVQAMPVFLPVAVQQAPMPYPIQGQAYTMMVQQMPDVRLETAAPDHQLAATPPVYPVLAKQAEATPSRKMVRVRFPYTAQRKDELTIKPNELIVVLEERKDGWCRGLLDDKEGLFPGNYAEKV